mgnify:CR=1 FL=1
MTPIQNIIINKNTTNFPIWFMRQAGRYLPEFRKIRKKNQDFIKLCLNSDVASEITLQPLNRFNLDAAIIFSDILMVPYALNQKVEFKKNFGPILGNLDINSLSKIDEKDFKSKLDPVYKLIQKVKSSNIIKNKDIIGFVGAPWTLALYMINKISPKKNEINSVLNDTNKIKDVIQILNKYLKIHILNQVKCGASIIQIFDSWAGLLDNKYLNDFVYSPTDELVKFTKSLNIPVICFPRGIKNYKNYCEEINPDVINIDYEIDPNTIKNDVNICVQGGFNPQILLTDKENIKKEAKKYLDIFADRPYIFNLGHGILPETNPDMVEYLVNFVKNY